MEVSLLVRETEAQRTKRNWSGIVTHLSFSQLHIEQFLGTQQKTAQTPGRMEVTF